MFNIIPSCQHASSWDPVTLNGRKTLDTCLRRYDEVKNFVVFAFNLLTLSPITQADEGVIFVGLSVRMSERISFLIREFRSSHKNGE